MANKNLSSLMPQKGATQMTQTIDSFDELYRTFWSDNVATEEAIREFVSRLTVEQVRLDGKRAAYPIFHEAANQGSKGAEILWRIACEREDLAALVHDKTYDDKYGRSAYDVLVYNIRERSNWRDPSHWKFDVARRLVSGATRPPRERLTPYIASPFFYCSEPSTHASAQEVLDYLDQAGQS
jgi:hypothetical protein